MQTDSLPSEPPGKPEKYVSSVQFSRSVVSDSATPWTAAHQPSLSTTNSCPSPSSFPLSQWCLPTISSSVVPFSSCLQTFPASGSFPMSQFFPPGSQSIGVSASASVLPMNTQDWFPLGWTDWISLQSKGLSRVFFNTTVQKHHLALSFLYSPTLTSIHDYWKNHSFDYVDLCWPTNVSAFKYAVWVGPNFSSKEQASFNFIKAVRLQVMVSFFFIFLYIPLIYWFLYALI